MPFFSTFPAQWTKLRDQGRLQFWREQRSKLWYAVFPELGEETRVRERYELVEWINARIARLPSTPEPQRVNGHPWPEALPASKNLLPRR